MKKNAMSKDELTDEYTDAGLKIVLFEKIVEKLKLSYDSMSWFDKIDVMIVVDLLMKDKVVVRMWKEVHTLFESRFENHDTQVKTLEKIQQEFDKGLEFMCEEERVNAIITKLFTPLR